MKKLLLIAVMSCIGITTVIAQKARTDQGKSRAERVQKSPNEIADMKVERLSKDVNLNEDQKVKIHGIFLKEAEANKERATYRKQTQSEVSAVLTEEQKQKWQASKTTRKAEMSERKHKRGEIKNSPSKKTIKINE